VITSLKNLIKKVLFYKPLPETKAIREAIEAVSTGGMPYCPASEGDMLFSLIEENVSKSCLEIGFYTGSTALYLAKAIKNRGGQVTSICLDDDESVARGLSLLDREGVADQHQLIRKNSNLALPELILSGANFDFIFMDGWKTFDHVVFEIYLVNQMLEQGGIIAFDDAYMPSIRKVISLLKQYYGYQEIDYRDHNQTIRLRLFHILIRKSLHRPYRALKKIHATNDQAAFQDWNFHRQL
jgi:predicted O-methyltransferase YrrM